MARDLLERLEKGDVLVVYGPIHTLLEQEVGRDLEGHLSEWIVNHPREFQEVTKAMYAAGCDVGAAGTQGNAKPRLEAFGFEDKVYEWTLKQVQLTKEVTPENCYVLGHLGPTGVFLEPVGDTTAGDLYKIYEEQISAMLDGGVDIIYCSENDTEQLAIAIKVAKDHCNLPVWAHNLFYPTKKGFRTMMGLDVKSASARLQEAGADVVGTGCGGISPIGDALAVVKEMRQGCDKPLSIKPDAGLAQLIGDKIVQPVSPEEMAREVPKWIAAGASLVGGCCGTGLEHIKAISAAVKGRK